MKNIYRYFTLCLNIYIVDVLFNLDSDTEDELIRPTREETAIVVGVIYVAPMMVLHLWDILKAKMDLVGHLRLYLQASLFRRYLNYSEESRASVPPPDMQHALTLGCEGAARGYMKVLDLFQKLGQLAVFTYFTLLSNPGAIYLIMAMPSLMLLFLTCQSWKSCCSTDASQRKNTEAAVLSLAAEVCQRYRLIAAPWWTSWLRPVAKTGGEDWRAVAEKEGSCCEFQSLLDYFQRPQMNEIFARKTDELRRQSVPESIEAVNNEAEFLKCRSKEYFPKWLGPLFVGVYIAVYAHSVFSNAISLGTFLATIGIMKDISSEFAEAYEIILELTDTFGSIQHLTVYFNKPTDLLMWKQVNRQRREATRQARDKLFRQQSGKVDKEPGNYKTDLIPIERLDGVLGIALPHLSGVRTRNVSVSVPQGKLVAVVGPHGSGKKTLLSLMGHMIFPLDGSIFIPSHLRILHVTQEAYLLNLSPWKNLIFGCANPLSVDPARVRKILQLLQMKTTLQLITADLEKQALLRETTGASKPEESEQEEEKDWDQENGGNWHDELTYSEKVKIHLARALIMNPEVMVLQRPLYLGIA
ncbi:Multidrug resistance protein pgp-1 (P-glycoprotein A) (P-glycoprotein-related protein 1) [Durusdinium trenchii]|uniref:Multidrug resistance protein pgp-1 (P-glycoprotein A) (P-glycoprotein-related protein 1) n=1 Tax=Durusdinium trenchii TaxID=1381693 RepID=A0ABP0JYQ5_9DINO